MNPGMLTGKYQRLLFYSAWLLLNLIQSSVTGLFDDEAYYWVYSRFLDWGYFDHPPIIALLIKIGYGIIPNELGLRLPVAILSTVTLWLVQKLLSLKDDRLFYAIAICMAVLQLGGIIAVPDVPLLFFTVLFFHAYKRFLQQESWTNSLFVGVCIALLLYSKYHGLLVIIFTVISNPRLILNPKAYASVGIALLLFAPHVYWQYTHGFPSLQYHLRERIESSYKFSTTGEYIIQQLLLAGPFATIVLFWAALRKKPTDLLERALKFTTFGFYLFFLAYSFRGRIEANWTFPAFIGLLVLSHQYLAQRFHLRKLVNALAIVTLLSVCAARIYLVGLFPPLKLKDDEFLFNREWTNQIKEKANGVPVFFVDSYQRASKYWFYTGMPTYSLNTLDYRRNNFNYWPMEDTLQHKKMYGIYQGKHNDYFTDSINTPKGTFLGRTIEDYFSFSKVLFNSKGRLTGNAGETISINLHCKTDSTSIARMHPRFDTACVWMAIYKMDVDEPIIVPTDLKLHLITKSSQDLDARVKLDVPRGTYWVRFGISSCVHNWPTINSSVNTLIVE